MRETGTGQQVAQLHDIYDDDDDDDDISYYITKVLYLLHTHVSATRLEGYITNTTGTSGARGGAVG
jgi:hypothetical protein